MACGIHITDEERALATAYQRGHRAGYESGLASARGSSELTIEHLRRRVEELEKRLDDATRTYEIAGDQVVTVDGYAYRWRGATPLEVGDRVLVPENWLSALKNGPGPREGTVTALGTTYRGDLQHIVRKLTN
ncbi:hypothetical protein DFJ66_2543 [Saccharothrix variisporea]|uniref:Uncharacterized protein n=1 Tax=Saccharothrix variisporea TaxID=543527 RepID=A0A495X4U7_9PSEU|nr:hypothetical protein DFJ66_2543 [Saccharothrix variisporea]